MPVPHDIQDQLQKIDEQLIDLLAERVNFCKRALEEDEEAFGSASQAETITYWEEEADARGLSLGGMNQLCKMVMKLCRNTEE